MWKNIAFGLIKIFEKRETIFIIYYLLFIFWERQFILTVTVFKSENEWGSKMRFKKKNQKTNSHVHYNKFHLQKTIWDVSESLHFPFVKLPKLFLFYSFLLSSSSRHKLVMLFSINNSVLRYFFFFATWNHEPKMTVVKLEVLFYAQFTF